MYASEQKYQTSFVHYQFQEGSLINFIYIFFFFNVINFSLCYTYIMFLFFIITLFFKV